MKINPIYQRVWFQPSLIPLLVWSQRKMAALLMVSVLWIWMDIAAVVWYAFQLFLQCCHISFKTFKIKYKFFKSWKYKGWFSYFRNRGGTLSFNLVYILNWTMKDFGSSHTYLLKISHQCLNWNSTTSDLWWNSPTHLILKSKIY